MLSYSPYDNLDIKEYPAIYVQMSLNDPRVPAWGNLKFLEKIRDMATVPTRAPHFGNKNIVCKISRDGAGHFGSHDNEVNLINSGNQFAWLDFMMLNQSPDTALTSAVPPKKRL
jgi:oligopeptidase B